MVCDRLLQEADGNPNNDPNNALSMLQQQRRFFAAQTLHTKCCTAIHELPLESLPSLRDSLLNHLTRYLSPPPSQSQQQQQQPPSEEEALTMRLAMCVSALAVHMGWTSVVTDLLANCSSNTSVPQNTNTTNCRVAMLVLRALPEECASDRLLLPDENNRFTMRDHLVSSAPLVFSFLMSQQQAGDPACRRAVFKTFHVWIRYVPVHPTSLVESALLTASIQAMTQPDYLELASDVLVEVLRMYPSHHYGNGALVQRMIPALSQLPLPQALQSDDEDVLRAYCRVVTEMGESYMSLILGYEQQQQQVGQQQQHQEQSWHKDASQLVEWVLRCSEIADAEIAGITLHFWYRMVMDLEGTEPYDWRQELVDIYTSHLLKLMNVCVTSLMRFPDDVGDIADDLVEDLLKHRSYVAETIEDCCRLLGGHSVLHQLGILLKTEAHKVAGRLKTEWHGIESCLACIGAIHSFVPSDEADILPFCFNMIPQLPGDNLLLRHTASKTIGKFASWLAAHSELLQPLLPYLAQGLLYPDCASAAAIAIKELCECSNQNFAIAEPVLQLYEEMMSQPGRLELSNELHILEGVCRALSRTIQDTRDDGKQVLTRLANPIGNRLSVSIADASASPRRIIPEVDRLTLIVRYLTVPHVPPHGHPIIDLLQSTWALLDASTNRFPNDNMLAEKICRLHKHALRVCGAKAYAPMLDALMKQLVHSFERTHQSPFLYAASICITEYGQDTTYTQRLFDMVAAMATTVFSFLRTLEELTNHPDVVEEFFYLMGRMMTYCPDPVVTSPLLLSLAQCAVVGMQLQHAGANKGTLKFLENTISYGLQLREQNKPESQAALEQVLSREGQAIVVNLARAMMGDLPAFSNQIPEILWKLNLLCPGLLNQWLTSAFASTSALPERAKADFMSALNTGLARDEFSLVVRAFQSACDRERRLRRMQRRH